MCPVLGLFEFYHPPLDNQESDDQFPTEKYIKSININPYMCVQQIPSV